MKKIVYGVLLLTVMLFTACDLLFGLYEYDVKPWAIGDWYNIDNTDEQNPKEGSYIIGISKNGVTMLGNDGGMSYKSFYQWNSSDTIYVGDESKSYKFVSCSDDKLVFKFEVQKVVKDPNEGYRVIDEKVTERQIVKSEGKFYYKDGAAEEVEVIRK